MGDGTETAVGLALAAGGDSWEDEAEQLDLLGLPDTAAGRTLAEKRGRGRPPGARNKRTTRTVEHLLAQFQDPRAVLLSIAQMPVEVLVARLGCKPMEALQEKRLAAIGVLPYVAQKQPLAVNLNNTRTVALTIVDGTVAQASGDDWGITATVVDMLENQALSDGGESDV